MGAVAFVFASPARLQGVPVGLRRSAASRWERRLDGDRSGSTAGAWAQAL